MSRLARPEKYELTTDASGSGFDMRKVSPRCSTQDEIVSRDDVPLNSTVVC